MTFTARQGVPQNYHASWGGVALLGLLPFLPFPLSDLIGLPNKLSPMSPKR